MKTIIKREIYLNKIRPLINKDIIKVITGIRRCGKSSLLKLIIEELKEQNITEDNIILINFDSKEFLNINTIQQLDEYIQRKITNKTGKIYLFFDEIQNIPKWEKLINSYYVDLNCDIYITGSNSNLLSGELATHLTGRYMEIKVYPFSYQEVLLIDKNLSFNDYVKYGGMPFIYELEDHSSKIDYLELLYNTIIHKDVKNRCNIKNSDLLDRIILCLIDNLGRNFSVTKTFNVLKNEKRSVKKDTIYNYLNCLEKGCLIHKVQRKDIKGKKLLRFDEKYYLTDWGFSEVLFNNTSNHIAQILENIVYIELLRRGYKVNIGKLGNKEIDFICSKNDKIIYIQVSYLLSSQKTIEREFSPLININDNYEKYVLSLDKFDFSREGIKHLNIEDFLLSNDL